MKKTNNQDLQYVIQRFESKGSFQLEEIRRALALFESLEPEDEDAAERYHMAYVMCRYMEPSSEDVITLLFAPAYAEGRIGIEGFRDTFAKDRFNKLFTNVKECVALTENNKKLKGRAGYDYNAMLFVCDNTLDRILDVMSRRGVPDTECVRKAYQFAKNAHNEVLRQSGEPYLNHPVAVAKILAEVGVESAVIAAALLHDVIEDSDYTHRDISNCCGEQVAKLVDAVTSVHKQYAKSYKSDEYSVDKYELDKKTFEKLVATVHSDRRLVFALYIKAADRIHNLSTIDMMSGEKKHNKTDETEYDYLPLFRRFGLRYFVDKIDDLMWRTVNPEDYWSFRDKYNDMYYRNIESVNELKSALEPVYREVNEMCRSEFGIEDFQYTAAIRPFLPIEVFRFVNQRFSDDDVTAESIDKDIMPVCDIDIILDNSDQRGTIDKFARMFIKSFLQTLSPTGRVMTEFTIDKYGRFIISVRDKYSSVIRLCFAMRKDYLSYRFGDNKDIPIDVAPERTYPGSDVIHIKLRNGKRRTLPRGATVLDAAFAIHPDIGMTAKGASINGEQVSVYNLLHDGDKVEIFADTERVNGVRVKYIPHVRIGWLEYVVTKEAKHLIVKTLENRYGDADPADTHKAQDEVVARVAMSITKEITESD